MARGKISAGEMKGFGWVLHTSKLFAKQIKGSVTIYKDYYRDATLARILHFIQLYEKPATQSFIYFLLTFNISKVCVVKFEYR